VLLCVPSLPICVSLSAPVIPGHLYLGLVTPVGPVPIPPTPQRGGGGFVGCCLQGVGSVFDGGDIAPPCRYEAEVGDGGVGRLGCMGPGPAPVRAALVCAEDPTDGDKTTKSTRCAGGEGEREGP